MRVLLCFFLSFTFLKSEAQKFHLLIGTYTGTGSKGIYVYNFDAATGKAKWISNTDSAANPSYVTASADEKYVYAVNETGRETPGSVSAYTFNKNTGKLKFINNQVTGGDDPCYVSVTKNNKWMVVANYTGGSAAVFSINKNGSLKPYAQLMQDEGGSVNKERQEKAHVHSAVFSPDEKYLFTPDLGGDKVMIYKFNGSSNKPLSKARPPYVSTEPGSGPRHFTFHPNGKLAYLIEELSGTVVGYKYASGKLHAFQTIATHPANYKGVIGSAEIYISPDGKFLYASNRGDENTITIFSIDQNTGRLKLKGYHSTQGQTPRNFTIDPTGNYLLVANQNTDNIVILKRDKQTGLLKSTGIQIKIPKPVCLQIIK